MTAMSTLILYCSMSAVAGFAYGYFGAWLCDVLENRVDVWIAVTTVEVVGR